MSLHIRHALQQYEYFHTLFNVVFGWAPSPSTSLLVLFFYKMQDSQGMVSCSDYQACFDYDALADVNNCLNGGTHGPVHIKVGGEWDDPEEAIVQALCE